MLQTPDTSVSLKRNTSTISSKGQITLPVSIRRYLGVNTNDRVSFRIDTAGNVRVLPAKYPSISSLQGAAGRLKKSLSWKKMKEIAYKDRHVSQAVSQNNIHNFS